MPEGFGLFEWKMYGIIPKRTPTWTLLFLFDFFLCLALSLANDVIGGFQNKRMCNVFSSAPSNVAAAESWSLVSVQTEA